MKSVRFVFLRARPDDVRGEVMNLGVVAFFSTGPRVYIDTLGSRLRALHPDFDQFDFPSWAAELETALPRIGDFKAQHLWLQGGLGAISADNSYGHIQGESDEEIIANIADLIERYVQVPTRTIPIKNRELRKDRGKLHLQLKNWFKSSKIYSPRVSDLSKGKIVSSYPIDVSDDLYADFALKNGAVHIIESLDLRGVDRVTKSVRGEVGLTAVLLDQARLQLSPESKRIAVTAADDYSVVRAAVHLVGRYADEVLALESAEDRRRLADFIGESLNPNQPIMPIAA
jgi:hypothetical protein